MLVAERVEPDDALAIKEHDIGVALTRAPAGDSTQNGTSVRGIKDRYLGAVVNGEPRL